MLRYHVILLTVTGAERLSSREYTGHDPTLLLAVWECQQSLQNMSTAVPSAVPS